MGLGRQLRHVSPDLTLDNGPRSPAAHSGDSEAGCGKNLEMTNSYDPYVVSLYRQPDPGPQYSANYLEKLVSACERRDASQSGPIGSNF